MLRPRTPLLATLALAVAATVAAPRAAAAQERHSLAPVRITADVAARAERLEAEAIAMPTRLDQFARTARMYEDAAALRGPADPRAAESLRRAAFLRHATGDGAASVRLLERAAERSTAAGDVVAATGAYIDAALIAAELGDAHRADALAERADQLLQSPLLDAAARAALRSRMGDGTEVASR